MRPFALIPGAAQRDTTQSMETASEPGLVPGASKQ